MRGLRVRFGACQVLHGLGFAVRAGGAFGLVRESGSGESTVLRALSGLNANWIGRLAIDGKVPARRRGRDFFRRMQMVFQDSYGLLHPRQTVDRLLSEPLLVHGMNEPNRRIRRALKEVALPATVRFRSRTGSRADSASEWRSHARWWLSLVSCCSRAHQCA